MRTIDRNTAHKTLTTKHQNLRDISDIASISLRKTNGRFTVRVENFETGQVFKNEFATMPGALVNYETMREFYL